MVKRKKVVYQEILDIEGTRNRAELKILLRLADQRGLTPSEEARLTTLEARQSYG